MKKILGIISVFVLTLFWGITVLAADELTVNTTSNTSITYNGRMDGENVFAVLVQVLDENNNVVIVDSATVTEHSFSGTFSDLTAGKSYTLRAANYDGGSWIEKEFVMPNQSQNPPSSGDQGNTGTPGTTTTPPASDTQSSSETPGTENAVTTSPAPASNPSSGKKNVPDTTDTETEADNISINTQVEGNAPATTMNTSKEKLMEASGVFTETEKTSIKKGKEARIWLEVKEATDISDEDKAKIEEKVKELIGDVVQPFYLDITLWKQVGNESTYRISEPGVKISVTITIPESLRNTDETKTRQYYMVRLHDGVAEVIEGVPDDNWNFTFETEYFSIYALIYQDMEITVDDTTDTGSETVSDTGSDTEVDKVSGTASVTVPAKEAGFNPIILICIILVVIIAVTVIIILRKKSEDKDEFQ